MIRVLLLLLFALPAWGATKYVSPSGAAAGWRADASIRRGIDAPRPFHRRAVPAVAGGSTQRKNGGG